MNKGMFYLLPFLVLTPVAASNALAQVEVANLLNVLERVRLVEVPKRVMLPKPISGRNSRGRQVIKALKPRAGRNRVNRAKSRLLKHEGLIKRK